MRNEEMIHFSRFLLDGNELEAWNFLNEHAHQSKLEVYENIITPSMRYIGKLWEENKITVADEHVATAVCDFLLTRYGSNQKLKNTSLRQAMLLCVEGEQHYLGLKMVNQLFQERGWNTIYFGPNLPLEYVMKKAMTCQPNVIGLSITLATHLPQVIQYIQELSSLPNQPTILIGGRTIDLYNNFQPSANLVILENLRLLNDWLNENSFGEQASVLS